MTCPSLFRAWHQVPKVRQKFSRFFLSFSFEQKSSGHTDKNLSLFRFPSVKIKSTKIWNFESKEAPLDYKNVSSTRKSSESSQGKKAKSATCCNFMFKYGLEHFL